MDSEGINDVANHTPNIHAPAYRLDRRACDNQSKSEERKTTIDRIMAGLREPSDYAKGSDLMVISNPDSVFLVSLPRLIPPI